MKPRVQHESMRKTQGETPGDRLRSLRQQRGFTLRDVHKFSLELARRFGQTAFVIPPSRLHEFEKKNIVPSIHRGFAHWREFITAVSRRFSNSTACLRSKPTLRCP